ncbi:MAG TPA: ATP-binding protein [Coleofasciculaceae cyanobacterium]
MTFNKTPFEQGSYLYPQPIALSCGRICRAKTPQEQLDAILKCAEVLTRYLAAAAISSFAARDDQTYPAPKGLEDFTGNLSFGSFLTVVQIIATTDCAHPLSEPLKVAFKAKDGNPGLTDQHLTALLTLRNELGHDLMSLTEAKAISIFSVAASPDAALATALDSLKQILRLPLFLVEEQRLKSGKIVARRLLFMGETADPQPKDVELNGGLQEDRRFYLGLSDGAICLYPLLIWDLAEKTANFGVYFIHRILDTSLNFITVTSDDLNRNGELKGQMVNRLAGNLVSKESVGLANGDSFLKEWGQKRQAIEQFRQNISGEIAWDALDPTTLTWYGRHLEANDDNAIRQAIVDRLLDGRDRLNPDEVRQLLLLFGRKQTVAEVLRRGLIDCRVKKDPDKRWDERHESSENILQCLKMVLEVLGRHIGIDGVTLDGLQATSGSADYIAVRESLVNLFIHQDYKDQSTVSQIEITPDRAVFFNAGKSLVNNAALVEGGKSQSRNPLISRALRLIGFAELAGSGLREIHRVWRGVKRRPPIVESNSSANTFSLTLDWRQLPDTTDQFWKTRLGVVLDNQEAKALLLSSGTNGTTADEVASSLGIFIEDAKNILDGLKNQKALVDEKKNRYTIKNHLKPLAEEAKEQSV